MAKTSQQVDRNTKKVSKQKLGGVFLNLYPKWDFVLNNQSCGFYILVIYCFLQKKKRDLRTLCLMLKVKNVFFSAKSCRCQGCNKKSFALENKNIKKFFFFFLLS